MLYKEFLLVIPNYTPLVVDREDPVLLEIWNYIKMFINYNSSTTHSGISNVPIII